MIELIDRARARRRRRTSCAGGCEWFDAYEADGGVISTWQDMRTSPELSDLLQQVGGVGVHPPGRSCSTAATSATPRSTPRRCCSRSSSGCPTTCTRCGFTTETDAIDDHDRRSSAGASSPRRPSADGLRVHRRSARAARRRPIGARRRLPAVAGAGGLRGHRRPPPSSGDARALDWPALGLPEAHGGLGLGLPRGGHRRRGARPGGGTDALPGHRHPARPRRPGGRLRPSLLADVAAGTATGTSAIAEAGAGGRDDARDPGPSRRIGLGARRHQVPRARRRHASTSCVVVARRATRARRVRRARSGRGPPRRRCIDPTLPLADVMLDDVEVDGERVLVEPGDPGRRRPSSGPCRRPPTAIALSTVATCRAIFETTVAYAKDREQFGRPIGSFQALKHRLADCYLAVERAAALGYFAALTIAEDDDRRAVATSMAKAAAGDCQRLVARDGLQLHGGVGFTWEHDLHFLLKRAKAGELLFGTAAFHRAAWRGCSGWRRGMRLRFDDSVEAFRAELLEWLAANRPSAGGDGGGPVGVDRCTPRSGPDAGPARCSTPAGWCPAGPPSSAVATPGRSRPSSTSRSWPGPGCRAPPTCRASASWRRRSSTTARPSRSATTPCRILRGEATACLGMSEPGAGSDLASLSAPGRCSTATSG